MAICVSMFFIYMKPEYEYIKVRQAKLDEYNDVLNKVQKIKAKRDELSSKYSSISQSDLDRMNKMIPKNFSSEHFVNDVTALAVKHNMKISHMTVNIPIVSNTGSTDTLIAQGGSIVNVTTKFNLEGTYSQFLSFLKDLETNLRLVDVTGLVVRSTGGTEKSSEEDAILDYQVDATTYALR